jgi:hypothetical protein
MPLARRFLVFWFFGVLVRQPINVAGGSATQGRSVRGANSNELCDLPQQAFIAASEIQECPRLFSPLRTLRLSVFA